MIIGSRYRLLGQVGQGGMGVVYKAADRLTGDVVALKQMQVTAGDLQFVSRRVGETSDDNLALAFEFRTLAGLRHPHIIAVLDFGFDDRRQPFFTMPLLEDAKAIIEYGKSLDRASQVRLIVEMLQALAYLHRRDIVHRDIKPNNVLVTSGATVKVMDFGLAVSHSQTITTGHEGVGGTLAYMAPELFEGVAASAQSDLFAAGVIAYQIFAGRYPFAEKSAASLMYSIVNDAVDTSMLDSRLAIALEKLLAKKPEQRYESAQAVIEAVCEATDQPLPPESALVRESYLQASEFVGRETELQTLRAALANILADPPAGSAWLIGGESGVGKSRLVDELRIRAMIQGALALRGQGVAGGGLLYQVWRDPLRRLVLSSEVSDTDAAILKELVPDIGDLLGREVPDAAALEGKQSQERLVGAIASMFQRQRQPIILILEDLHWAMESLEPLRALNNMAHNLPLLIVGNYRDEEAPDLPDMLPEMNLLKLARLSDQAIERLSASMLGEAGRQRKLTSLLKRETEGNAFFMVEVVRILAEEAGRLADIGRKGLPDSVFAGGIKEVVNRRLRRVPEWGQGLLRLAAVAGRQLDLKILQQSSPDLDSWLNMCANAAVLEFKDGQWHFSHDKLRETLIAGLSDTERIQLNRQVAEAIEAVYPGDKTWAVVLLEHWRQAGDTAKEVNYACQAVKQLLGMSNFQEAAHVAERTLPMIVDRAARAVMLAYLGEAQHRLGNNTEAREIYLQSVGLAREANDPSTLALCLQNLGQLALRHVDRATARDYYQQSLEIAREIDDRLTIAQNLGNLGDVAALQGDFMAARGYYEQSLAINRQIGDKRGISNDLMGLGWVGSGQSDYVTARRCFEQSLAVAREIGDRKMIAGIFGNLGAVASAQGDYRTGREYYQQQLQINQEIGHKAGIGWALWAISRTYLLQADYAAASEYTAQSLAIHRALGDKVYTASNLRVSGQIAYMRGEYLTARSCYEESLALARDIGQQLGITSSLIFLGQVAAAQGDYATAQNHFERGLTLTRELNFKDGVADSLCGLGELAAVRGEYETAHRHFTESLNIAHAIRYIDATALNLIQLGLLASLQGDQQTAISYLKESLRTARQAGLQARAASAFVHLGFAYLAGSDARRALDNLADGLRLAHRIGAWPIALEAVAGIAGYYLAQGKMVKGKTLVGLLADQPAMPARVVEMRLKLLQAMSGKSASPAAHRQPDRSLDTVIQQLLETLPGAG